MTTISAEAILVSRNVADPDPNRKLATVLCRYPRWIHAELMTHRAFSRNAASSRAIPVDKMIKSILDDPAVPMFWGSNKPGMQAGKEHDTYVSLPGSEPGRNGSLIKPKTAWIIAMDRAIETARSFADAGYHKQIVNRLLEPFMHITVLISATEWNNFFELRIHDAAEPHIRLLTERIKAAIDTAPVQILQPGDWHLPFIEKDDYINSEIYACKNFRAADSLLEDFVLKLSVARCASTSYKTVDGFDMTIDRAVQVYDKLVGSQPLHASPCEHVAKADGMTRNYNDQQFGFAGKWDNRHQHRNFVGFRQHRAMIGA